MLRMMELFFFYHILIHYYDCYSGALEGLAAVPALRITPTVLFIHGNCQIPVHVLNKIKFTEQDYDSPSPVRQNFPVNT